MTKSPLYSRSPRPTYSSFGPKVLHNAVQSNCSSHDNCAVRNLVDKPEKETQLSQMSKKRARSPPPPSPPFIFQSDSIEDRSSKFTAVYSPTLSAQELQALPEYKEATHLIAAWRKPSAQRMLNSQPILETGYDDDGEKYGGKTLEKVLVGMSVEGAVVVARWYGGVMLGPVRFDHIRNCASQAIRRWKVSESEDCEVESKKAKLDSEEKDKAQLIKVLRERDQSIAVLRDLLAGKSKPAMPSQSGGAVGGTKLPDYETLPSATLKKLETVRDKTIGWVLQEIEKAEEPKGKDQIITTSIKSTSKAQLDDGSAPVEQSMAIGHSDTRAPR
ncbi:hypothetical protein N7G274_008123 [Stereocaulon virgatum]|uniref:Impact N-terminal domain-containing protein n=1 Tax=Stereocaulon virgatum TaxID=373712 RepID=A0ABR3ZZF6_9LECA